MTAGSYCYIGPQGIVHGTYVYIIFEPYISSAINNISSSYQIADYNFKYLQEIFQFGRSKRKSVYFKWSRYNSRLYLFGISHDV
jgi:hypothetical protein